MFAVGGTFLVYAASVAAHQGEFWPFSIFPMFSRAGKPWTRALVLELPSDNDTVGWGPWSIDNLPGNPVSTRAAQVSTNDLSKLIQLTKVWSEERTHALRTLFASMLNEGRTLLLLRVNGGLAGDGELEIKLTGLVRMNRQSTQVNPALL